MEIELLRPYSDELRRPVCVALDRAQTDVYREQFRHRFPFPSQLRWMLSARRGIARVVDVGANIGQFSLATGMLNIPTLAIEALADNFVLLAESLAANALECVLPIHLAATDVSGLVPFGGHSAWGEVVGVESARQFVPGLPLDRVLPLAGFARPDLIKIDVEGHERAVLRGLHRTLDAAQPMLIVESNAWSQRNEGYQPMLRDIEALGYRLFMFLEDGTVVARDASDIQEQCVVDFLAIPTRRLDARSCPPVRSLTLDQRLAMLAAQPAQGMAHCWHAAHAVDRFESMVGPLPALEDIRQKVRGNADAIRGCREWSVALPDWVG